MDAEKVSILLHDEKQSVHKYAVLLDNKDDDLFLMGHLIGNSCY